MDESVCVSLSLPLSVFLSLSLSLPPWSWCSAEPRAHTYVWGPSEGCSTLFGLGEVICQQYHLIRSSGKQGKCYLILLCWCQPTVLLRVIPAFPAMALWPQPGDWMHFGMDKYIQDSETRFHWPLSWIFLLEHTVSKMTYSSVCKSLLQENEGKSSLSFC